MWNFILSGLKIILTLFVLIIAIIGILVCILEDLISYVFKLNWNKNKHKSYKTNIVKTSKLLPPKADRPLIVQVNNDRYFRLKRRKIQSKEIKVYES